MLRSIGSLAWAFLTCAAWAGGGDVPTAVIADSAVGGGKEGAAFYYLSEFEGEPVRVNILFASIDASRGRGADLRLAPVERRVRAGRVKLKMAGQVGYAAPVQSLFKSAAAFKADGVLEADLQPNARYRVKGALDAYRREVWLEEEDTGRIVGQKFVAPPDPAAVAKAVGHAAYTCCNLRYQDDWISDANWATLPFIPAGARIAVGEYGRHRATVVIDGRVMRVGHDYGRAQESKEQFVAKLLVHEDPKLRIAGFPAAIQAAIHEGKVMPGMTREQVIISLGHPRTDVTRSADLAEWTYWTLNGDEYVVIWGSDQRVKEIDAPRSIKRLVVQSE
ncbi:hypothetical protein [uncultured Methylibium sp.]|uniref:hypothetical protein n=1 Tax=uncultured Methylibium sp. TaxID=381093 RepID=UPI0025EAE92F|nr:hypothetical protein [uncultured Methylibium sp.]